MTEQPLYEIKGVLTKFMRMLFPLEFRIDSISDFPPALPFRYPLLAGEVIRLPEKVEAFDGREAAFSYYKVLTAHLAGRHEFGTFSLRLADLPGFEERAEVGVEALSSFISSFEEPEIAGALLRLCESVRIDAELKRKVLQLVQRRHTTLSAYITEALQRMVESDKLQRMVKPTSDVEQI